MHDELVKELRDSAEWADRLALLMGRAEGDAHAPVMRKAADAIEELMRFAHFVAQEVVVSGEEWENNEIAFPEIASRKLHKIGIVEKDGAFWHYEPPKEET